MNLFDGINENDKDAMLKCLDMQRILTVCSSACEFHTRLIHNLLTILAEKNLMLTHKIEHMAQKNTRDKLLSYLSSCCRICLWKRKKAEARNSVSLLTGSSWRIICLWTEAPCPGN